MPPVLVGGGPPWERLVFASERAPRAAARAAGAGKGAQVRATHKTYAKQNPVDAIAMLDQVVAEDHRAGETTFVFAVVHSRTLRGASVGDSGAWLVRPDGALLDLTAGQRRKPLVGSGAAVPISFGPHALEGRLLLASDGLFKYATRECIIAAVRIADLDEAVDALVALPRLPNGKLQDDVAVVLAEERTL